MLKWQTPSGAHLIKGLFLIQYPQCLLPVTYGKSPKRSLSYSTTMTMDKLMRDNGGNCVDSTATEETDVF